jgi:signal peptide peptidase SppA
LSYEHVIRAAGRLPWAIESEKLDEIVALLELKANGGGAVAAELLEDFRAVSGPGDSQAGGVAVLNVFGVMAQRMNMLMASSGGVSTEVVAAALRQAVADPNVAAIVLNIDSPGGSVFGIDELATEIRAARAQKPIVAIANSTMASAAYYVGSAANEVVTTPGGRVGSIGVFMVHVDESGANEQQGLKLTVIKAGKFKAEFDPSSPLSDEALAYAKSIADTYYDAFVVAVAAGRGVSRDAVRSGFGQGRVVLAKQALATGMVDRIETLDQTIARLMKPQGRAAITKRGAAAVEDLPIVAEPLHELTNSDTATIVSAAGEGAVVGETHDGSAIEARMRRLQL